MTTREIRGMELAVQARMGEMAAATGAAVSDQARTAAMGEVAERIGSSLSGEQQQALEVLGGPERAAVLVGQAGAGKGIVIDAAVRASSAPAGSRWVSRWPVTRRSGLAGKAHPWKEGR